MRFTKSLKSNNDFDEAEKAFATSIFYVEKETGANITEEYSLMKFYSLLDELVEHNKREQSEIDRSRRR